MDKRVEFIKNLKMIMILTRVIFTVDIFNEGVDIPSINTVLFFCDLQTLNSVYSTVRTGLRKHKNKEFFNSS